VNPESSISFCGFSVLSLALNVMGLKGGAGGGAEEREHVIYRVSHET